MYRITIDRDACDGVFACLVRDGRFAEDSEGLATLETDGATVLEVDDESATPKGSRNGGGETAEIHAVAATFDDDQRDDAEQAAAACPLDAIHVETVEEDATADAAPAGDTEEVQP